mmetsp:Transcript_28149/g.50918  ORF Transcript_28149/g.50918 Transcript_28149/m.50918 type:complete len:143 (+) Transcript_28149:92-520(+)
MTAKGSALSLPLIVVTLAAISATLVYTFFSNGGGGGDGDGDGDDHRRSNDNDDADVDDQSELRKTISELTKRNQELEATVASLSKENAKFVSRSAKEKKNKTDRRTAFKSKLANMSEKMKGDFGNEFEGSLIPEEKEEDISS